MALLFIKHLSRFQLFSLSLTFPLGTANKPMNFPNFIDNPLFIQSKVRVEDYKVKLNEELTLPLNLLPQPKGLENCFFWALFLSKMLVLSTFHRWFIYEPKNLGKKCLLDPSGASKTLFFSFNLIALFNAPKSHFYAFQLVSVYTIIFNIVNNNEFEYFIV
jgi:hypothetical protein